MVLGLGSRGKKDRTSTSPSLDFDLHIYLHEIKPWYGVRTCKTPSPVTLRWSRAGKPLASSKSVIPADSTILFNETLHVAAAPFATQSKKDKKPTLDSETVLLFSLLDSGSPKAQPLAQTGLNLAAFSTIQFPKTIAIPLTLSKKVSSKGSICYLHLTVEMHKDDADSLSGSGAVLSSSYPVSDRHSDASMTPPLEEETQQSLVTALLSGEEDGEVASFTDDDVSQGSSTSHETEGKKVAYSMELPFKDVEDSSAKIIVDSRQRSLKDDSPNGVAEEQIGAADARLTRPALSPPQAMPVKAAAIAAANAYVAKRSIFSRTSNLMSSATSYDPYSDPESLEDLMSTPSVSMTSSVLPASTAIKSTEASNSVSMKEGKAQDDKYDPEAFLGTGSIKQDLIHNSGGHSSASSQLMSMRSKASSVSLVSDDVTGMNGFAEMESIAVSNMMTESVPDNVTGMNEFAKMESIAILNPMIESSDDLVVDMQSQESSIARDNPETEEDPDFNNMAKRSSNTDLDNSTENVNNFVDKTGRMAGKIDLQRVRCHGSEKKPVVEARSKPSANSSARFSTKDPDPKPRASRSPDEKRGITGKHVERHAKTSSKEAGIVAGNRVCSLEAEVEKLKGELRDVAAVEAAVYSTIAEHGSSSFKIHAPARRLARMYMFASKHWSKERKASCAKNVVAGLVTVARACGHDVSRLTFWWSNAAVLRESIAMAFNLSDHSQNYLPLSLGNDWTDASTLIAALKRLEGWIYAKVVESLWWQILTLQMQKSESPGILDADHGNDGESSTLFQKRKAGKVHVMNFEDGMHKSNSVEIWKKVFSDAHERLCPVRGIGVECGCLPMLSKLVLEECVARLDIAMFNAILRDDEASTDPVSDPISDPCVLPISTQSLSFGQGAQLKNAVATLSSWVSNLIRKDVDSTSVGSNPENKSENLVLFPMLKAMGGLLMLPKDMLIDKSLRKEVCPMLSLPYIERILSKFKPDEFSPEPVSSDLLETISSEMAAEYGKGMEVRDDASVFQIAMLPPIRYMPPQSIKVRHWIGEPTNQVTFGRSKSSVLRKGHTSDDEIDELESPVSWLVENTMGFVVEGQENTDSNGISSASPKGYHRNCRFRLLREVWKMA